MTSAALGSSSTGKLSTVTVKVVFGWVLINRIETPPIKLIPGSEVEVRLSKAKLARVSSRPAWNLSASAWFKACEAYAQLA